MASSKKNTNTMIAVYRDTKVDALQRTYERIVYMGFPDEGVVCKAYYMNGDVNKEPAKTKTITTKAITVDGTHGFDTVEKLFEHLTTHGFKTLPVAP